MDEIDILLGRGISGRTLDLRDGGTSFLYNMEYLNPFVPTDSPFAFFCRLSIPRRGERATWNALNREPGMDSADRADAARIFEEYFNILMDEEKEQVLKEGFTRRTHDMLAKIAHNVEQQNQVFDYSEQQKSLEDELDGFSFRLPPDSDTMHALDSAMHNCVYSYVHAVASRKSTIVYATRGDKYELCIELDKGMNVKQARSDYNAYPTGQARNTFMKWCVKHGLRKSKERLF